MSNDPTRVYLAVDLGAESGRVVAGVYENDKLDLVEVHRFPNGPKQAADGIHWDLSELFKQITHGLRLAGEKWGGAIASIGVDTWGVDYGLLDADGELIAEPFHYRDSRTDGMQEQMFKSVPRREVYGTTGIQFLPFNTLYQLAAEKRGPNDPYTRAEKLLFVPDLINYLLTGRMCSELTIASTSQFLDARTRTWAKPMLEKLGLDSGRLCELVEPGQVIGTLSDAMATQTKLGPVPVVAVGAHDTASAVAAVPASGSGWAYLSSGTWSLMGIETRGPVINDVTYEHGFTNEAGVLGTVRLLKNISGLWLLQECKRAWEKNGNDYSYSQLVELAEKAAPFSRVLNPDDPCFAAPGGMPGRIDEYLKQHGQEPCADHGQMVRTIIESLAARYTQVITTLEQLMGVPIRTLHIVGGGSQNGLLNQCTADATGRRVITGPVEATGIGNMLMQMIADGALADLAAGRALVDRNVDKQIYEPRDAGAWQDYLERFASLEPG